MPVTFFGLDVQHIDDLSSANKTAQPTMLTAI